METLKYTPESVLEKVGNIEERLMTDTEDLRTLKSLTSNTKSQRVSYVGNQEISVGAVLADPELTQTAIIGAQVIQRDFLGIVGKMPEDILEVKSQEAITEVLAHNEILQRARSGQYNGRSERLGTIAEFYVGQYIGSAESMRPVVERFKKKGTIFQS